VIAGVALAALLALVELGGQPARLELDAAWHAVETEATADGPALVLRDGGDGLLAVTVAMAPNPDAWRTGTRAAYEQAIIDGFAAEPGITAVHAKASLQKGVPCIDLTLRRDGKPVAVRLLLFRTRTVAAAVEGLDAAAAGVAARGLIPTREAEPSR
jgi:hypothetical protein